MSNKEDLQAIDNYIRSRSFPTENNDPTELPLTVRMGRWNELLTKWNPWHYKVSNSFFISDQDILTAKTKRNDFMYNKNAKAKTKVDAQSKDAPGSSKKTESHKTFVAKHQKGLIKGKKYAIIDKTGQGAAPTVETSVKPSEEKQDKAVITTKPEGENKSLLIKAAGTAIGGVLGFMAGGPVSIAIGAGLGFLGGNEASKRI
jgi:hypothetical protein